MIHEISVTSAAGRTPVLAVYRGEAKAGTATRHYAECSCGWSAPAQYPSREEAEEVAADHVQRQVETSPVAVVIDANLPAHLEHMAFINRARAMGVTAVLVDEEGPGAGWPMFTLAGDRYYVRVFLREIGYDPADVIS